MNAFRSRVCFAVNLPLILRLPIATTSAGVCCERMQCVVLKQFHARDTANYTPPRNRNTLQHADAIAAR